jgi:uncharacterized repeat protein (TIGR03803 family)
MLWPNREKTNPESFMKSCIKIPLFLPMLVATLGLILASRATAQIVFTNLFDFNFNDGAQIQAGLVLSGNRLYGAAAAGGTMSYGMLFAINTDGTSFTNLYNLNPGTDGSEPEAALVLSNNILYGTASHGGNNAAGTVFAIHTDGTGFTNLYTFNGGTDGLDPFASLVVSGGVLYGTASQGGNPNNGTVFAVNINGTANGSGFTNLHTFTALSSPNHTNTDGTFPMAGLVLSGNVLYGTASGGGNFNRGTVFALNINTLGFTNLHSFTALSNSAPFGNIDGISPLAPLIISGNTLYGTASKGGSGGDGTVFRLNTDGTGFTNLYSFSAEDSETDTNTDGANPEGALVLSGNNLYGTTFHGGSTINGTLFAIHTDGTGFTNLFNFTGGQDGASPAAGMLLSSNVLYGTALDGDSSGAGTVFSLSLGALSISAPQLTITQSGTNVIVSWLASGFNLQSTTNLAPPVVWAPVTGQNAVTNLISGTQMFYRLSQ